MFLIKSFCQNARLLLKGHDGQSLVRHQNGLVMASSSRDVLTSWLCQDVYTPLVKGLQMSKTFKMNDFGWVRRLYTGFFHGKQTTVPSKCLATACLQWVLNISKGKMTVLIIAHQCGSHYSRVLCVSAEMQNCLLDFPDNTRAERCALCSG